MIVHLVAVGATLLTATIVLLIMLRHSLHPDADSIESIDTIAMQLIAATGSYDLDEDALVAAIGGIKGIHELRRAMRIIGCMAAQYRGEVDLRRADALRLMLDSWIAALFIGWPAWCQLQIRLRWLPCAPIPSVEALARMFLRMAMQIQVLKSVQSYA